MNLRWWRFALWILAYMALALVPMAIALAGDTPAARARLVEVGAMLGLLGLGMLSMQAVVSGRQRWFARGLGPDDLLQLHRQTGIAALLLVFAHPLAMFAGDPATLAYLDPRVDPLRAASLAFVLVAVVVLVATSLWRTACGLSYEHWRLLHGALSLAVVALGLGHALMVGHYTGEAWQQALLVLAVGATLALVLQARLLRPWRMRRRPWRVAEVRPGRDDSCALRLVPEGHDGLTFAPGQYAWLTTGGTPWRLQQHPFSLASGADDGGVEFTIKALGDYTDAVAGLAPGSRAFVEGPYGAFVYVPGSSPTGAVFIAGGVGITPVLSILRTVRDRGAREPLWLLYGNGGWDGVIAREELAGLADELPLTLVHVLTDPPDDWDGERGIIDEALLARHLPDDVAQMPCYVCGPDALADGVEPLLLARGVPARHLYSERFSLV